MRHEQENNGKLITVAEACERLSVSRSLLYKEMDGGRLGYVKIGRARRIRETDLDALVERGSTPARQ